MLWIQKLCLVEKKYLLDNGQKRFLLLKHKIWICNITMLFCFFIKELGSLPCTNREMNFPQMSSSFPLHKWFLSILLIEFVFL